MSPALSRTALERRALALAQARRPHALCTVVRVSRPASVRPGDAALVHPDGRIEGFVGGHCAADTVRLQALRAMETGEPTLLRIVPGPDDAPARDGAVTVENPCLSGGELEIFVEPRRPAPRVVVVGDSPVGDALAALGPGLGFEVETAPGPAEAASLMRPGGSEREDEAGILSAPAGGGPVAVVVAALGHGDEAAAVRTALEAGAPYVGLVASRRRGGALVGRLAAEGIDESALRRLRTPAGVDIGARTHAEIALAVLAEIVAVQAGRAAEGPRVAPGEPSAPAPAPAGRADVPDAHACCHDAGVANR